MHLDAGEIPRVANRRGRVRRPERRPPGPGVELRLTAEERSATARAHISLGGVDCRLQSRHRGLGTTAQAHVLK